MTEPLTLDEYQDRTAETAVYPKDAALVYLALGMGSEAGEFQGYVKKVIRGDFEGADISKPESLPFDVRAWLIGEIGDQLWYLAEAANVLGVSLSGIANDNLAKLADRADRGTLKGSGEDR
jgi:NTP pyrophosphatase (non-canonical NTP hydrolase)